jgi:fructosamine-3-kinase
VPAVLDHGVKDGKAFILLERLDLTPNGDWGVMGRALAALHRKSGTRFGWQRDNYIGLAPQINTWKDDWAEFFVACRLRPQASKAGLVLAAAMRASRLPGPWYSIPRCTTAIARRTSR